MKRIALFILSVSICTSISLSICHARILNVPEEYQTIQAGLNAAAADDTVLVQPGLYSENVVMATSQVTLASLFAVTGDDTYIDSTIIDGGRNDCVISMDAHTWNSVLNLRGFTVRNGRQGYGGGIDCQVGRMLIEDMLITDNEASMYGGGVFLTAHESGGATVTMRRCRIIGNRAGAGGGVGVLSAILTMEDCIISENTANRDGGGGVYTAYSMYVEVPIVSMNRVLLTGNTSEIDYGAAFFDVGNIDLNHLTVVGNNVGDQYTHGGLSSIHGEADRSEMTIRNSILRGNEGFQLRTSSALINASYLDMENGREGLDGDVNNRVNWGEGIIDVDPQFVNVDEGDFHLAEDSPCIDAGDPNEPDLDGTRPELGAFMLIQRSATIGGRVLDLITENPIPDAYVEVLREGGVVFRDTTDAEGSWGQWTPLWADPLHITVQIHMNRYTPWTCDTIIHDGEHVSIESLMGAGVFEISNDPQQFTLYQDDSLTYSIEIRNVGNAPINWSASWDGTGLLAGNSGEIIDSVAIWQILNDDKIDGVAFDGENYYFAGANGEDSSMIYMLDSDFRLVRDFPQPCHTRYGMKDLEWDGELLWGSGDTTVYGVTPEGDLRVSFRGPFHPNNNIAYDPVRRSLWVSATTTDIIELDRQGNALDSLSRKTLRVFGLGWDEFDPDGYKLQILSVGNNYKYSLYKMNTETNDTMMVCTYIDSVRTNLSGLFIIHSRAGQAAAIMTRGLAVGVDDDYLDFIQLRGNREWLTLSPLQGRIGSNEATHLDVLVRTTGPSGWAFESGQYDGVITIKDDGLSEEVEIPFTLNVSPNAINDDNVDRLLPNMLALSAFPNPFNSMTTLHFSVGQVSKPVRLAVYGVDGRLVEELWTGRNARPTQNYSVTWNADRLPGGVYLVRLESGNDFRTIKAVLIK